VWAPLALIGSVALGVLTRPSILRLVHGGLPRFPYLAAPLSPAAYDALAARPLWAKTSITVADGVSLKGLVRRPRAGDAPWVLFFPGNDESQLTAGQDMLERLAGSRDWGLLVYADRGYDSSDGTPSADALREDGYRILTGALAAEHVEPKRLHVVAFSMGGYVAAAAVGRAAREHAPVASLSMLAAVEKMEMVHSLPLSRIVMGDIFDTMPLLDDVPAPVLVQHGIADTTLDVSQGRAIAAKLGPRATLRELPGVGHHDILRNEDALAAVRSVIEAALRR
jgi:pimeloyl-ACP methyl ester carboxylesterase